MFFISVNEKKNCDIDTVMEATLSSLKHTIKLSLHTVAVIFSGINSNGKFVSKTDTVYYMIADILESFSFVY